MKCIVCGKEFELNLDKHYISRDEVVERIGIIGIVGNNTEKESKLYDTFDCPYCGCQNIAQERKRSFVMARDYIPDEELEDEDKCDKETAEEVKENKILSSCFGTYNYEDCEDIDCGDMPECKKAKEEEMKRISERCNKENKENEVNECY